MKDQTFKAKRKILFLDSSLSEDAWCTGVSPMFHPPDTQQKAMFSRNFKLNCHQWLSIQATTPVSSRMFIQVVGLGRCSGDWLVIFLYQGMTNNLKYTLFLCKVPYYLSLKKKSLVWCLDPLFSLSTDIWDANSESFEISRIFLWMFLFWFIVHLGDKTIIYWWWLLQDWWCCHSGWGWLLHNSGK